MREDLRAFKQKKVNLGKGEKELEAKKGDLVLIKNTDNEKQGIYGVVYEIEDNSTATIRTKKGMMRRAICQLIPLAGSSLVQKTVRRG